MAAQNETVAVPADTWTLITDADVSAATFQNTGQYPVLIKGQNGTTAPTDQNDALVYRPGEGETNLTLANKWLGVTTPNRIFAYCPYNNGSVFVSHA